MAPRNPSEALNRATRIYLSGQSKRSIEDNIFSINPLLSYLKSDLFEPPRPKDDFKEWARKVREENDLLEGINGS